MSMLIPILFFGATVSTFPGPPKEPSDRPYVTSNYESSPVKIPGRWSLAVGRALLKFSKHSKSNSECFEIIIYEKDNNIVVAFVAKVNPNVDLGSFRGQPPSCGQSFKITANQKGDILQEEVLQ